MIRAERTNIRQANIGNVLSCSSRSSRASSASPERSADREASSGKVALTASFLPERARSRSPSNSRGSKSCGKFSGCSQHDKARDQRSRKSLPGRWNLESCETHVRDDRSPARYSVGTIVPMVIVSPIGSPTVSPCVSRSTSPVKSQRSPSIVSVCRGNTDLDIDMDFDMMRADAKVSSSRMKQEKTSNLLNVDSLSQSRSASPCGSTMASPAGSRKASPMPDRPDPPEPPSGMTSRAPSHVGSPTEFVNSAFKYGSTSSHSSQSSKESRSGSIGSIFRGSTDLDVDMDVEMMKRDTRVSSRTKVRREKTSNLLNVDSLSPSRAASPYGSRGPSPFGSTIFSPLPDRPGPPEPVAAVTSRVPSRSSSGDCSVLPGAPSERNSWASSLHSDLSHRDPPLPDDRKNGRQRNGKFNADKYSSGYSFTHMVIVSPAASPLASPLASPCGSRANSPVRSQRSPSVVSVCRGNTDLDVEMEQDMMKNDSSTREKTLPIGKTASRLIVGSSKLCRSSLGSNTGSRAGSRAASPMVFERPAPPEPPSAISSRAPSRASSTWDEVNSMLPGAPSEKSSLGHSCACSRSPSVISVCRNNSDLDIDMDLEMMKRDAKYSLGKKTLRREKTNRLEVGALSQSRCNSPSGSTAASASSSRVASPMPDRPWNPEPTSPAAPSRSSSCAPEFQPGVSKTISSDNESVAELGEGIARGRNRKVTLRGFDVDVDLEDDMLESQRPKRVAPAKKFSIYTVDTDATDDERTPIERIISPASPLPSRAVNPEPPSPAAAAAKQARRRPQQKQKNPLGFFTQQPASVCLEDDEEGERKKIMRRITVTNFEDVAANLPDGQQNKPAIRQGRTRTLVSVEVDRRVRVVSSAEESISFAPSQIGSQSVSRSSKLIDPEVASTDLATPDASDQGRGDCPQNSPCQMYAQPWARQDANVVGHASQFPRCSARNDNGEDYDSMLDFLQQVAISLLAHRKHTAASYIQAAHRGKAVRDAQKVLKRDTSTPSIVFGENMVSDAPLLHEPSDNDLQAFPTATNARFVESSVLPSTQRQGLEFSAPVPLGQLDDSLATEAWRDEGYSFGCTRVEQSPIHSRKSNRCPREHVLGSILNGSQFDLSPMTMTDMPQRRSQIQSTLGRSIQYPLTPSTIFLESCSLHSSTPTTLDSAFSAGRVPRDCNVMLQDVIANSIRRVEELSAAKAKTRMLLDQNEKCAETLEADVFLAWQKVDELRARADELVKQSMEVEAERYVLQENYQKQLDSLDDRYCSLGVVENSEISSPSPLLFLRMQEHGCARPASARCLHGCSAALRPQSAVVRRAA